MSSLHNRWLAEQLPEWERDGIVTADGARRLRERYALEGTGGLVQLIVGAVGGLLIGTGLVGPLRQTHVTMVTNHHDIPTIQGSWRLKVLNRIKPGL